MPEKGKAGKAGIGRSKKRKGEQKFFSTLGFASFFVSSPPATSVSLIHLTTKKKRRGGREAGVLYAITQNIDDD